MMDLSSSAWVIPRILCNRVVISDGYSGKYQIATKSIPTLHVELQNTNVST